MSSPRIAIITGAFNAEATILDTLCSVHSQREPASHIVIDGGSRDDTVSICRKHLAWLSHFSSERDRGIYDAMNKGVALVQAPIVGILNSDDYYADAHVLADVADAFEDPSVDAVYGDLLYVSDERPARVVRYWRAGAFDRKQFYLGWMPPHPAFFVRRSVYQRFGGFRLDCGSAADYEFMLRTLFVHRLKAIYVPRVLVHMRTGGASNVSLKARLRANRNDRNAWRVNGQRPLPFTLAAKPARKLTQWLVRKVPGYRDPRLAF